MFVQETNVASPHPTRRYRVAPGLHAHRTAGRHRDHRHPDRTVVARRPEGSRGCEPRGLYNNLTQLGTAALAYHAKNGAFPDNIRRRARSRPPCLRTGPPTASSWSPKSSRTHEAPAPRRAGSRGHRRRQTDPACAARREATPQLAYGPDAWSGRGTGTRCSGNLKAQAAPGHRRARLPAALYRAGQPLLRAFDRSSQTRPNNPEVMNGFGSVERPARAAFTA